MSCGCSGAPAGSRTQQRQSAIRIAAVVAVAWLIAKREWGLLVVGAAALVVYRASTHPHSAGTAAPGGASPNAPGSFTSGTDNVSGSPSPDIVVPGSSSANQGDCS